MGWLFAGWQAWLVTLAGWLDKCSWFGDELSLSPVTMVAQWPATSHFDSTIPIYGRF